jgi:hypothetical protein
LNLIMCLNPLSEGLGPLPAYITYIWKF